MTTALSCPLPRLPRLTNLTKHLRTWACPQTRSAGPLGRQRLTAAGKTHSEWPGGKSLLTPAVVFVNRCQNMHADSLIRTRLLKPPATAVPSGASPLTGTSCLLAEAESASEHAWRLRSSCNSFLSVRAVHWPSEHVSPVTSRSPLFIDIETCYWHSFDQSASMSTAVTGSSPPAFLWGHQMAQVRSPCLMDRGDPAQILWNSAAWRSQWARGHIHWTCILTGFGQCSWQWIMRSHWLHDEPSVPRRTMCQCLAVAFACDARCNCTWDAIGPLEPGERRSDGHPDIGPP